MLAELPPFSEDLPLPEPLPELDPLPATPASVHRIAPGGEATLEIRWKAGIYSGPLRQTATITTNDPAQPRIELAIEGAVITPVELSPSVLLLHQANQGSLAGEAFVFSTTQGTLPVPAASSSESGLTLGVEPLAEDQLRERGWKAGYRVRVAADGTLLPGERLVAIATQLAEVPELTLLVAPAGPADLPLLDASLPIAP